MSDYQVIARKFRPQTFKEVVGQEAIVATLKNAVKFNRLAQAYLFCGPRGTGKTTLARLLAKALNCQNPDADCEPCDVCSSCREIAATTSLDVLEIDGASHRGIEDIRQINETVGYAPSCGRYKVYLIDEVHMLTKEAFNALLKTLEEPPPKVKFFFATTEPHKLPPTIVSRCQRFNLHRIPPSQIFAKLARIAKQLQVEVDEEALRLIAKRAEGGLRDAESLFDQILAFEEGPITAQSVAQLFGLTPQDIYFAIDRAGKKGDFAKAFEIAHQLFSQGKDLSFFIEGLIEHLRRILLIHVVGPDAPSLGLMDAEKEGYLSTARYYSQEQCLDLIDYLLNVQQELRTTAFNRIYVEMILLHVMRSHFRLPIEYLVRRLGELEQLLVEKTERAPTESPAKTSSLPKQVNTAPILKEASLHPATVKPEVTPPNNSVVSSKPPEENQEERLPMHHYDTLLHFAAVEWEGRLQKHVSYPSAG